MRARLRMCLASSAAHGALPPPPPFPRLTPPPLLPSRPPNRALPAQGAIFKKIVDSIKDLVSDTNLECASNGITLQAMDSSHVALVALSLKNEGFEMYRCDRNISLGMNLVRGGAVARRARVECLGSAVT